MIKFTISLALFFLVASLIHCENFKSVKLVGDRRAKKTVRLSLLRLPHWTEFYLFYLLKIELQRVHTSSLNESENQHRKMPWRLPKLRAGTWPDTSLDLLLFCSLLSLYFFSYVRLIFDFRVYACAFNSTPSSLNFKFCNECTIWGLKSMFHVLKSEILSAVFAWGRSCCLEKDGRVQDEIMISYRISKDWMRSLTAHTLRANNESPSMWTFD